MRNLLSKLGINVPTDDPELIFSDAFAIECNMPYSEIVKIDALKEIIRKFNEIKPQKQNRITNSKSVYRLMKDRLKNLEHEEMHVLLLRSNNTLINIKMLTRGGLDSTVIDPRLVAIEALKYKAKGVVLVHNHPSGSSTPSKSDIEATRKIKKALELFNVSLLDHVIVSSHEFYSFAEELTHKAA